MSGPKSTKEKVLHTRVPEDLEAQIKALADALRVPVSSLVRNILEDSVAVIDTATSGLDATIKNVSRNVKTLQQHAKLDQEELRKGWGDFQAMISDAFRARSAPTAPAAAPEPAPAAAPPAPERDAFPDVIGWQTLTLNLTTACAACARAMVPGELAHLGVRDAPGPRVLICDRCLPRPSPDRKEAES